MFGTNLTSSAVLKSFFWRNVSNVDSFTKVYKYQISLLTITCTVILVSLKYVKKWKRKEDSSPTASGVLREIVKPSEIMIVDNDELCIQAANELLKKTHHYRVVGLDCEWVCDKVRHPIALLQLATSDGFCALIRLSKLSSIPSSLVSILEDSSIIKVGSAIKSDVHLLRSDYNISAFSCLDISVAAKSLGLPPGSLKKMAKDILDIDLNKDKALQCSNWEVDNLSDLQAQYAALDALIPVKIVEKMMLTYTKISRQLDENEAWNIFLNTWHNVLDVNYSFKSKPNRKRNSENDDFQNIKQHKGINIKRALYENCFLQDPDGNVLCVCNNKKLNWYIEKGLGVEVSESPRTVRLNFMPRVFNRTPDSLYYMKEKENKCVVCGQTNSLRRKNVVPCEYRTHFPKEIKEYKSHDVVLLCAMCHTRSSLYDQHLRRELTMKCEAPVLPLKLTEEARRVNKLKYAANALLTKNPLISSSRIEEIKSTICDILNCEEVTDDILQEIKSMKLPVSNERSMSHGQKVVKYFQERNELNELEILWRNHFINTMKPRHLPDLWSITHDPKCSEYSNFHKALISLK